MSLIEFSFSWYPIGEWRPPHCCFCIHLLLPLLSSLLNLYTPHPTRKAEKEVFNFHKPGPLGFVLFVKCNVMSEWSVLKPGKMSALEVVDIKLALIKKKV